MTSAALYVAATRVLGARRGALRPALAACWSGSASSSLLVAFNLAVGFVLVLALRKLTGSFVSLYLNTDGALLALSLLQAAVLQWWMRETEP